MKRKGNVMAIISVTLVIILGVVSLVTDVGVVLVERNKLQYALDAAVLAGVKEMPKSDYDVNQIVTQYLILNDVDPNDVTIEIDHFDNTLHLSGNIVVQTFFARVLGINQVDVGRTSSAQIGTASSVEGGLRPFAVEERYYDYGDLVTLKTQSGYHGNYGAVALGGRGANVLKDNALNGYDGTIRIGDMIDTEPGNMSGAISSIACKINSSPGTFENYPKDTYRLWTIPVVDSLDVNGRDYVEVIGFAQVFVEDVAKKSGKMEITARFIEFVASGEIDVNATNYGLYASKLIQ